MLTRQFTEEQGMFREAYRRFLAEEVVPHMERFHATFMLSLGRNMGELEKEFLRECRAVASAKCLNKSRGGEGIHLKSLRFSYIAVRYRDSPPEVG